MARVLLGPVRFSYLHLFEPYSINPDSEPKYSATFLIPKDDKKQVAKLKQAIKEAEKEGVDKVFGGKMPPKVVNPIHDGDGTRDNGEEFGEECKGHLVFTASTKAKFPPGVLAGKKENRHPATVDEVKSGDYGYITINFRPYNYNGKKGIGAYLQNVWKTKNGEPLGGARTSAEDDFKSLDVNSIDFGEDEIEDFELMNDELPF